MTATGPPPPRAGGGGSRSPAPTPAARERARGRRRRLSGGPGRGLELGLSAAAGRPELLWRLGLLARRHAAAQGPGGGVQLGLVGTDPGRQGLAARVASRTRSRGRWGRRGRRRLHQRDVRQLVQGGGCARLEVVPQPRERVMAPAGAVGRVDERDVGQRGSRVVVVHARPGGGRAGSRLDERDVGRRRGPRARDAGPPRRGAGPGRSAAARAGAPQPERLSTSPPGAAAAGRPRPPGRRVPAVSGG